MVGVASLTIRGLDPELKERLRVRAARNHRSMEEEARVILRTALVERPSTTKSLGETMRELFGPSKGVELEIPPREPMREPPKFR